jgi:hypothetical protein
MTGSSKSERAAREKEEEKANERRDIKSNKNGQLQELYQRILQTRTEMVGSEEEELGDNVGDVELWLGWDPEFFCMKAAVPGVAAVAPKTTVEKAQPSSLQVCKVQAKRSYFEQRRQLGQIIMTPSGTAEGRMDSKWQRPYLP